MISDVLWCACFTVAGPKRSTLQDMLVNLGNQDDSSVQANSVSSPRAGNNMTSLDDSGEYDQEELGDYGE